MNDQEEMEYINKCVQEGGGLKCAIWDSAAKEHGKRGMCGDCFDIHYIDIHSIPIEINVERLGMPWQVEWKNKEELLEMYPT